MVTTAIKRQAHRSERAIKGGAHGNTKEEMIHSARKRQERHPKKGRQFRDTQSFGRRRGEHFVTVKPIGKQYTRNMQKEPLSPSLTRFLLRISTRICWQNGIFAQN